MKYSVLDNNIGKKKVLGIEKWRKVYWC